MLQVEKIPDWGQVFTDSQGVQRKYYPLHQYQRQILTANTRFICACAGTGGGKTVCGPVWCIRQIQQAIAKYGKCTGMIIAPTYKVLSRATMPAFVDTLSSTDLQGEYKESKSQYVLPNNWGVIWCQGADNPGGLEGGQFDFVWGDEGGQFKKATFEAITGRTGFKQAPILITTTPYGLGPLYTEWYKKFITGHKDYTFVIWNSIENPKYPREEFERARSRLSPDKFQERYCGKFMQPEGLVYPDFYKCHISLEKSEIEKLLSSDGRLRGGIDFGWNDPFCALAGFLDRDNVLWIFYERYKSQTVVEEHAKYLPQFARGILWYADPSNPEAIRRLRIAGHNVKPAKRTKGTAKTPILNGILLVNERILTGRLKVIINRCPALVEEAGMYVYPDKDEEFIGEVPEDRDNHAMDALRYLISSIDFRKQKVIDQNQMVNTTN